MANEIRFNEKDHKENVSDVRRRLIADVFRVFSFLTRPNDKDAADSCFLCLLT